MNVKNDFYVKIFRWRRRNDGVENGLQPFATSLFGLAPPKYVANDVIFIDNFLICRFSYRSESQKFSTSRATGKVSSAANEEIVNKNYVIGKIFRRRRAK